MPGLSLGVGPVPRRTHWPAVFGDESVVAGPAATRRGTSRSADRRAPRRRWVSACRDARLRPRRASLQESRSRQARLDDTGRPPQPCRRLLQPLRQTARSHPVTTPSNTLDRVLHRRLGVTADRLPSPDGRRARRSCRRRRSPAVRVRTLTFVGSSVATRGQLVNRYERDTFREMVQTHMPANCQQSVTPGPAPLTFQVGDVNEGDLTPRRAPSQSAA